MSSPTDGKAEIKAILDVKTQCVVVGSDECVNTLFGALATLGTVTISSDSRVITVTRRALDGAEEEEEEPKALPYNHQAVKECTALRVVDKVKDEQKQLEAKLFGVSIEDVCVFHRRNNGDVNISAAALRRKRIFLFLYCAEESHSLLPLVDLFNTLYDSSIQDTCVFLVDFSLQGTTEVKEIFHTLFSIYMAFFICAHKMLRWEPKLGFLDAFLSLISDASTTPRRRPSAYPYPPHISNTLPLDFHPVPLPVMPAILDITCADVTIAQMIMQLVHDYRSQFPFLTVSMALRAWLKTNNHLAIGVVCMARFLADSETIDLSAMNLDSVPEALQTLTSSALNLSRNFIKKLPKWLAKAPNVRFGHWYGGSGINHIYIRTNIHKLVFVGDTGVGKTTLLRCLMEGKKKLKAKHAHTGIAVYRNVTLKGAENSSYTIWDLGGDSLSPFHQWFLLSRSVFIVTFDVSKALMMEEPHMAVYKWLNEISVARSKGSKTGRCIIPVGTHMDQVDPHDPKLAELLTRVFMLEDVVFLVDLNKGKGWRCDKCQMEGLGSVVTDVCKEITGFSSNDDGVPKVVPTTWMSLKWVITKRRAKGKTTSLIWKEFVEMAKSCGIPQRPTRPQEIDQCAMFLADIGTIVHFRYPSWYRTELHNLVILEPRSFWLALTVHYNWFLSGRKVFFHDLTPPLALALREIADHQSYRQPEQSVFNTYGCLSFLPIPSQTCGKLEEFKATGHTAPTSVTGRLLKFPVFPQELFVKAMSTLWSLIFWGWTLECRREGAFLLAHSCSHSRKAHLFITCQDAIVSLYMQEECDNADCWPLKKRADLWANLMSTFSDLGKSVYARFEEKSGSYLPATVELFPCTACLKYWDSCPEKWFHSDRPTAFPPTLSCFTRDKIFNAVKNGVEQLTCRNRSGAVDIDRMAPDIVELHQAATEFASKSPTPAPTPTFLSLSNPIINIALGDLLSLLIEKGNGTTSVLDQVLPISLRLKILQDVVMGLKSFHGHKPPIAHGKLTPENIIVLSLGKSGKGNRSLGKGTWAKIKYSGWLTTKPISPEDVTFLSPEVLCNTQEASVDCVSPSADVWSFGITASLLLDPLKRPYEHLRTNKKYLFTDYSVSPPCNNCLYPMAIGLDLIRGKITPFPSRPPPSSSPPQPLLWRLGHQMTTLCLDPNPATRSIHTIVRVWDYFLP